MLDLYDRAVNAEHYRKANGRVPGYQLSIMGPSTVDQRQGLICQAVLAGTGMITVCDLGCADGSLLFALATYHEHYDVCIHPRKKYGYEETTHYDAILMECHRRNKKVCIIGDPGEGNYFKAPCIHDLRAVPFDRCMGLAATSDLFIGSNSVYACHRYYSNGGYAMIYSPWTIGDAQAVTHPKHLNDPRYHFVDSNDEDMVKKSIDLVGRLL